MLSGSALGEVGIGENWIGASPRARAVVKGYAAKHGDEIVLANKHGSIELPNSLGGWRMNNPPHAAQPESFRDSEYPLLNAASRWLELNAGPGGSLLLLSERIPCESCTGVIEGFMKAHPNIEVDVHYLFESSEPALRHASDFNAHFARAVRRPRLLYTQFVGVETVRFQDVSEQTRKTQVNPVAGTRWDPPGVTSSAGRPTAEQDILWHANLSVGGYVGPKRPFPCSVTK